MDDLCSADGRKVAITLVAEDDRVPAASASCPVAIAGGLPWGTSTMSMSK